MQELGRATVESQHATPNRAATVRPSSISRRVLSDVSVGIDALIIMLVAIVAYAAYPLNVLGMDAAWEEFLAAASLGTFVAVTMFRLLHVYEFPRLRSVNFQMKRVALGWTLAVLVLVVLAFLVKVSETYSRGWLLMWWAGAFLALAAWRLFLCAKVEQAMAEGRLLRSIAVVGAGAQGARLLDDVARLGTNDYRVMGVFDDRRTRDALDFDEQPLAGSTDDLIDLCRTGAIEGVVIALPGSAEDRIRELVAKFRQVSTDVAVAVEMPRVQGLGSRLIDTGGIPLLQVAQRPLRDWQLIVKWLEDKVVAATALLGLAPLMLCIGLAIKLESPGPIMFRQRRFGYQNKTIIVHKFRSMYVDHEDATGALPTIRHDPRVTRVGRFLRRFSLDELPQFLDVLQGRMSVVGPRAHPLAMRAAGKLYHETIDVYFARHRVKPGITGWAQVNGLRGEVDTMDKAERRIEHDLYYVNNWSLGFDLRIILLTVFKAVLDPNAY